MYDCPSITMSQLAEDLPGIARGYLQFPVVDATGMSGNWAVTLEFTPSALQATVTPEDNDPRSDTTIFQAGGTAIGPETPGAKISAACTRSGSH